MLIFCDSVSHYTTAQIAGKYPHQTFGVPVYPVVVPGAGRFGAQALFFDGTLGSTLLKTFVPPVPFSTDPPLNSTPISALGSGGETLTLGFAIKAVTLNDFAILALSTTGGSNRITLLRAGGTFQLAGDVSGVCSSIGLVAGRGVYLELQIKLNAGSNLSYWELRLNGTTIGSGGGPASVGTTFTALTFGPALSTATWYLTDLYVLDGHATQNTFLGDQHVCVIQPVADGVNLSSSNTPWVTEPPGPVAHYLQVDQQLSTDGPYTETGLPSGNLDSFRLMHPRAGATQPDGDSFGFTGSTPWSVTALQWVGRLESTTLATPQIAPVTRRIVGGTIPTDTVAETPTISLGLPYASSAFACAAFDQDPTITAAWQFDKTFLQPTTGVTGTVELGIQKIAGVA